MDLSICILTKNEEEMIAECIRSVLPLKAKEIILIDDMSSDNTAEIARSMGAKIFTFKNNNFSEARNFALNKAQGKYVLYIDADERLSLDLVSEIKKCVLNSSAGGFSLRRKNFYLGKPWPKEERLERLFLKKSLKTWKGLVHESPVVNGTTENLNGYILHYTHRNLEEMLENTLSWSEIEAQLRFKANHPPVVCWRFFRVMLTTFFDYYFSQGGWKVGTVGLIESVYQAFSMFITYARLWEKQQKLTSQSVGSLQ